jgi:rubrerythrin
MNDFNRLVLLLQHAYSGEMAAGLAYRGHWHSVSDPLEREHIRSIEEDEWHHRHLVGDMLHSLGCSPDRGREIRSWFIGRILQVLCHVSGWLAPMYGAGKLERRNIVEYEDAARFARGCGKGELTDCLLTMAEVEWEHEQYFRQKVIGDSWGRRLPIWPAPPPKSQIRASFEVGQSNSDEFVLRG